MTRRGTTSLRSVGRTYHLALRDNIREKGFETIKNVVRADASEFRIRIDEVTHF